MHVQSIIGDKMGIGEFMEEHLGLSTLLCAAAIIGGIYLTSNIFKKPVSTPRTEYRNDKNTRNRAPHYDEANKKRVLYSRDGKLYYDNLDDVNFETGDEIYKNFDDIVIDRNGNVARHPKIYTEAEIQSAKRYLYNLFLNVYRKKG